jgi:DNA-binding response OmpR family regulator
VSRPLLIISNPYEADVLRSALGEAGFVPRVTNGLVTADDLLDLERDVSPVAVVVCERLSGTTAEDVLTALGATCRGAGVPIVVIEEAESRTSGEWRNLGADAVVPRPLDLAALVDKILTLVGTEEEPKRVQPLCSGARRLEQKYAQVQEGTYFEVLDLNPDATGEQIREAYSRLLLEFDPTRVAEEELSGQAERLSEILEVVEEAFLVLNDPKLRAAYRERL